jgi:NAD(P)-dependent dehydrogenase (short-subunit alcohol dehydrogenase family)
VNNAGVVRARGLTKQGFELMFGVNHLGHFVLTNALLDCLTASAPARVVTVSSDSHYAASGIDFEALRRPERGVSGMHGYGVSKLCNVLFSQELARRTAGSGVTTYALHPGVVASDIWRRVPWPIRPLMMRRMLTVDQGAATSLYCATSPDVAHDSGKFYEKCAERAPSKVATPELAAELWKRSEEWAASASASALRQRGRLAARGRGNGLQSRTHHPQQAFTWRPRSLRSRIRRQKPASFREPLRQPCTAAADDRGQKPAQSGG